MSSSSSGVGSASASALSTTEQLSDLTSFYFDKQISEKSPKEMKPIVSSESLKITLTDETRGRGMVATRDLPAGTCLFVIPPTVSVPFEKLERKLQNDMSPSSSSKDPATRVESAAEHIMWQEMVEAIEIAKKCGDVSAANSFLVLEGSTKTAINNSDKIPSLDCLLGLEHSDVGSIDENAQDSENLWQIIRRNAFGPDFVTYTFIARNLPKRPHRILGLYPLADMMNHSCQPNTIRVYVGEYMMVHTSANVAAGEELTASYVPPTFSYPQRQAALQQNHQFECSCSRCHLEAKFWENPSPRIQELVDLQQGSIEGQKVKKAISFLEDNLLPTTKPSDLQRSLRLGFTPLYMAYLNHALATKSKSDEDLLRLCMQLHFAFMSFNPSSTEHLSVLHLGYELMGNMHSQPGNDQSKTLPRLQFWTEQVKQACMIRYGSMGQDLESVRRMMQHTRMVLRTSDGMNRSQYAFI